MLKLDDKNLLKMVVEMQESGLSKSSAIPIPVAKEDGLEVKSGRLNLIQTCDNKTITVPVFVRVYRNSYEHYAVIYRDQMFTNSSIFISLKQCVVFRNDNKNNEIRVIPDNMEGTKLTFHIKDPGQVEEWISALQSSCVHPPNSSTISPTLSPVIPRTPLMPTLQELEEEEEEEQGNGND
ncbi:hypothetical protein KP79_PYT12634 [Mizuhopecten yessoensis]|uniref:PH domain-containing protein n=1 Tax=Mizuhopecten yessoensis TaxID=6573 RepID=A0A210Q4V5_MIZYE|nr:hypothetical protein KP79_PYT12634 [Mizuhopecten yessoensis]